jgi:serine/threonine protein kinase
VLEFAENGDLTHQISRKPNVSERVARRWIK